MATTDTQIHIITASVARKQFYKITGQSNRGLIAFTKVFYLRTLLYKY